MWSRFNPVGMRQRWGTLESDPGRLADAAAEPNGERSGDWVAERNEAIRQRFYAREILIDCPHSECAGKYFTESREILSSPGSGSKVVLRCSRQPEDHDMTLHMRPYDPEEVEKLASVLAKGDPLRCPRCDSPLERTAANEYGEPVAGGSGRPVQLCTWCGVRWISRESVEGEGETVADENARVD